MPMKLKGKEVVQVSSSQDSPKHDNVVTISDTSVKETSINKHNADSEFDKSSHGETREAP